MSTINNGSWMNHPQMNLWISSSETQESAFPSPPPPNGGVHPKDTKVSEETVNVHGHEFRRGFLRMDTPLFVI